MTTREKDHNISWAIWLVAVAAVAFIAGQGYGLKHAPEHNHTVTVYRTAYLHHVKTVQAPIPWNPKFTVCHPPTVMHKCLFVDGHSKWIK